MKADDIVINNNF